MDSEIWLCDVDKNTECRKMGCFINGGPCMCTTKEECAYEIDGVKVKWGFKDGIV